ncbi:hypothetical protein LWI29_022381 [Acer saccharum]|uniref:Uncharacterized protein n=1 Tax=Acer saccharum TaxID=4024 RepID=A0AA39TGB8_ACESA|nr:hypothetical protein LWI29_022381 [Acer saccharum]
MVGARKNGEERPQYDHDVTKDLFSFRVHHGEELNGNMDNYIGGTLRYVLTDDEENHVNVDNGVDVVDINGAENDTEEHGPASEEAGKRYKGKDANEQEAEA